METIRKMLEGLTIDDLCNWAGNRIFNRGKKYVDSVSRLSRLEDGTLVAWVSGTDEYATWVRHDGNLQFACDCTCPYEWKPCKHEVAVLLAAAGKVKRQEEIPLLSRDDLLYVEAFPEGAPEAGTEDDLGWDDSVSGTAPGGLPQIEALLAEKSRDELQALLVTLALDFPEVLDRLQRTELLESGQVDQLARSLRRDIRDLTSEDAWYDHWKGTGHLPDYSRVENQLKTLLARGYADIVLELGLELWERGMDQVARSHDEGETAQEIASCMTVVLRALPRSSLTPAEQIGWWIERQLEDEYRLVDKEDDVLDAPHYRPEDWRSVAAVLKARLENMDIPRPDDFSAAYRRGKVVTWLGHAYSCGDEAHKVIPLLEAEAERCRSYNRLVDALLESGRTDQARHWCIQGFYKTIQHAPGIASQLKERLLELAESEGQFALVAACRADDFFEQPSEQAWDGLQQAAEKAGVWTAVRDGVLAFLHTGARPDSGEQARKTWPLPEPEVQGPEPGQANRFRTFPDREILIKIALRENRHDDAVALYREMDEALPRSWDTGERLARAVRASHPQVSLEIWQMIAENLITEVKPKAYREAGGYLRRMREVYEQTGRWNDWQTLLARLRAQHKAKRRLMEVLDEVERNRKLVE